MFTLNVPVALQDLFPKCGKSSHKIVDFSSGGDLLIIEVDGKEIPLRLTRFDSDSTMVLNDLIDGVGKYIVVKHIHGSIYTIDAIVESVDVIAKPHVVPETTQPIEKETPPEKKKSPGASSTSSGCSSKKAIPFG